MNIELDKIQNILDWIKKKILLDALSDKAKKRNVKRGQVYRCNFGYGIGSEMQKERPAVVVQNDVGNNRSGNTIVLPITHDSSNLPCVTNITTQLKNDGSVLLDGQANASNIICVSKARLGDYITSLSAQDMKAIDAAIAKSTGLMHYYSGLLNKLEEKNKYIAVLKEERNRAQDDLNRLTHTFEKGENMIDTKSKI